MYNPAAIQASFQKLVGILPPYDPRTPKLTGDLLDSDSGIYVQNIHPLCSLDNIYYAAPDFTVENWYAWESGNDYFTDDQVRYGNKIYQAVVDVPNSTVDPATAGTGVWIVINPFQNWVQQKYNQAASNMIMQIVQAKKLSGMGKALLERQQLYRGTGNINNLVIKQGRFVGYIIKPASSEGLIMQIDLAGIQSTAAQAELNFYLYHSSQEDPLGIFPIEITKPNTFDFQELLDGTAPCVLPYMGGGVNSEGYYIFGYYEDDLVGQAISKSWNCAVVPCYACDGIDAEMYNRWSRFTTMRQVLFTSANIYPDRKLPNINNIGYQLGENWGVNFSITVRCDLTNTIIYSRLQLADAFAKQLAKEFITAIAQSSRVNPANAQIQTQARAELDVKFPGSWINDYNQAIEAANIDLSGFNAACMPKDASRKLNWSTI